MNPAPPVTRTLRVIAALQAEKPLEGLEQTVASPGLRGFLEGDGRLVQKLVEQRVTEMLDLPAVVGAQMREAAQRALQLGGAHLVQPLAELFQDGHHHQPAIPCPEALDLLAHDALRRRDVAAALGRGLGRHRLEIVNVVQEHVLELGDGGLHVARHAAVELSTMSAWAKCSHASSSESARAPSCSAIARARSYVRLATRVTRTPSDARQVAASSAMSPAPRMSAERPASRVKMRAATATAAEGADAAPVASPVSLRTRAPTSKADWNSRCNTGPACAFDVSHASRTCPWICDSPRIMASSPAETRYR